MNKMKTFLLLAALAAAPACSKKDDASSSGATATAKSGGGDKAAPSGGDKAPDKPADKPSTIDKLKLAYDGPAGDVSDMSMGGDEPTYMVQAPGLVFSVTAAKAPKTLEAALDDASMYSPTVTVKEKTSDGYHLEFHNSGSMGDNYFVEILRTIGGKPYVCSTTANDAPTAAAVAKVCQSLRAI